MADGKDVAEHIQDEKGEWCEHIPEHAQRTESEEFRHTKVELEQKLHERFCFVCAMQKLDGFIAANQLPAMAACSHTVDFGGVKVQVNYIAWYMHEIGRLGLMPEQAVDSHHDAIEWCHSDDASWMKVNMKAQQRDWYGLYALGLAQGRPFIADPDDDRTQLILCDPHHKNHKSGQAVHFVSGVPWDAQWVVGDGKVALEPLGGVHGTAPVPDGQGG